MSRRQHNAMVIVASVIAILLFCLLLVPWITQALPSELGTLVSYGLGQVFALAIACIGMHVWRDF